MIRYFYTIINSYHYYNNIITNILKNKNKIYDRIIDLNINKLINLDVRILVLDFDGVLNSHGEAYPHSEVIVWLKDLQSVLGPENIFILSNKPSGARIQFFATHFPGIRFIQGVRKKPYPDGLEAVFKLKELSSKQILQVALVDDRLLTGMLATCIAGCQGIYIQKPYIQFNKRPIVEFFFQLLRKMERLLFQYVVV